jgi:hypothetical protein
MFTEVSTSQSMDLKLSEHRYDLVFNDELASEVAVLISVSVENYLVPFQL